MGLRYVLRWVRGGEGGAHRCVGGREAEEGWHGVGVAEGVAGLHTYGVCRGQAEGARVHLLAFCGEDLYGRQGGPGQVRCQGYAGGIRRRCTWFS